MINLLEDNVDINSAIKKEKKFLTNYLKSQERINNNIHTILRQLVDSKVIVDLDQSKELCENLSAIVKVLKKSNNNLYSLKRLLKKLDFIVLTLPDYNERIDTFNSLYSKLFDDVVKTTTELERFLSEHNKIKKETVETEKTESNISEENTLIISEVDNKVVLPYTMDELNNILKANPDKYETIKDVIDRVYTIPIKYYKNSSIMRFKEAFKLVREREHGTFSQALDLAMELFSNYNLHPAVITACKNLNELDVYLSCLEYNELDDFHFFKTIFKMHPVSVKTAKN